MSGQRFLDPDELAEVEGVLDADPADEPDPDDATGDVTGDVIGERTDDVTDDGTDDAQPPARRRPRGAFGQRGPDYDEPVYVISVAADLADLHPQTLRSYEREGLIEPARTSGNTRRYSQRDIDQLRFIRHLTTEEGLNLAGVRVVLDLGDKLETSRSRVRELEEMVRTLAQRLQTDVEAAHRSHRFEVVPAGRREMEPHPTMRRRPPKTSART